MRTSTLALLLGLAAASQACSGLIGDSHQTPIDDDDDLDGFDPQGQCDITITLARNGCTQSGCHGASYVGGLDLASVGLAERLIDVRSQTASCSGHLLIDPAEPENSLLLQVINPDAIHAGGVCTQQMPMDRDAMSAEDRACVAQWVQEVVDAYEPPEVEVFQPALPETYAAMVKTLLTSQPLSASELGGLNANPGVLRDYVEGWVETEAFRASISDFLANALQSKVERAQLPLLFGTGGNRIVRANGVKLVGAVNESVVHTALDIIDADRPFTEILTTHRWWMNTALLTAISWFDLTTAERTATSERHTIGRGAVPTLATSIATKTWVFPQLPEDCTITSQTAYNMLGIFNGAFTCKTNIILDEASQILKAADYEDWRYVDFTSSGTAHPWYDLIQMRAATQLTVKQPRVGFFSQPAFQANWVTNADNDYRVLINQTLIATLDATFSAADPTDDLLPSQIATDHAAPGTQCYGCHRLMDPIRGYFSSTMNVDYSYKKNATPAAFAFFGHKRKGGDIETFAAELGKHPRFALAWTQKLCMFATAHRCDESDPEVQRIAKVFKDSGFKFKRLVVELFTSPLVTRAEHVQTFESVEPFISVNRRASLCNFLEERTGVATICTNKNVVPALNQISGDSFARGEVDLVQAGATSAFHMAAAERLCNAVAPIAVTTTSRYKPSDANVIENIVAGLMGLPVGHSRHNLSVDALDDHVTAARAAGATAQDAVRSAFVAACMSTDVLALGM